MSNTAISVQMAPKKEYPSVRLVQALQLIVNSSALIPYREELNGSRDTAKLEKHVELVNAVYKVTGPGGRAGTTSSTAQWGINGVGVDPLSFPFRFGIAEERAQWISAYPVEPPLSH